MMCTRNLVPLPSRVNLSVPTRGKLDPKWEGGWLVKSVKGLVNVEISDGKRTKFVHVNRLQHKSANHSKWMMYYQTYRNNGTHHKLNTQLCHHVICLFEDTCSDIGTHQTRFGY